MHFDRSWLALGIEAVGLATAVAVLCGVPLAWIVENRPFRGGRAVSAIITSAAALPAPMLCFLLLMHSHVISLPGLAAMGVLSVLPLAMRQMRSAFAQLSPAYGKAARSLGLAEVQIFARVEVPLVWRAIAESALWALARLLLELSAAVWIAERLA